MDQESEAERSLNLHKDTQQESSRAMAGTRQAGYRTSPLHHLPLRGLPAIPTGLLAYTIYFLDQISHYRELAFYTSSVVLLWHLQHFYLHTFINPYGSNLLTRRKQC